MTADQQQLLAILATNGHYDPDGIGRGARPDHCPTCRAPVLAGLDADRCALVARTDPHDIDPLGEYLALRLHIPTYNIHQSYSPKGKQRWELNHRTLDHLQAPRRTAVVAAHRCGITIPTAAEPFPLPRRTPAPPAGATPPF